MKREDLKALGLTDEQIESVMTAHGQSVQSLNTQVATLQQLEKELQTQVSKHEADLKQFQKENLDSEELKHQIKKLQKEKSEQATQYQESIASIQRDSALNSLLAVTKAKKPKAVAALLDNDKIVFKDGELSGAKEQLEALQKSDSYLFDLGTKQGGYNPAAGSAAGNYSSFDEAMEQGDIDGYLQQKIESEEI